MLNILKKVGELRRDVGGSGNNGLKPPKNLPDLARDIYEHDESKPANSASNTAIIVNNDISSAKANIVTAQNTQYVSKQLFEPSKDSVPQLDVSLVRQHLSASQSAVQSIKPDIVPTATVSSLAQSNFVPPSNVQQLSSQSVPLQQSIPSQQSTPQRMYSNQDAFYPGVNQSNTFGFGNNSMDDSTGFFKELEDYMKNNGLNNEVIENLLNKNLLDHMAFYYNVRGDDAPFYASSAEISHAIKLKLEDLQNLERNWIVNKQKIELLKKLNLTLESDIHIRSEELKRLMSESVKRGVTVKSADFFQIVRPKSYDTMPSPVSSHVAVDPAPLSSYIAPNSMNNPVINNPINTSTINTQVSHNSSNDSIHGSIDVSNRNTSFLQQPNVMQKFLMNRYVTNEPSKYFYANNGQVFKSLSDLMDGIETMDRDTFSHHVTSMKNDFSNWIVGVFNDVRLSDAIRSLVEREKLWYYLKNNTTYM